MLHRLVRLLAGEDRHPRHPALRDGVADLLGRGGEGAGRRGPAGRPAAAQRAPPRGRRAADPIRVAALHLRLARASQAGRMSLRVLLVSGSYPPMRCGVGDYTATLAEAIGRQPGAEVAVLTSTGASSEPVGSHHRVLNAVPTWRLSGLGPAWRAVQGWNPDLVHVQIPTRGYNGRLPSVLPIALRLSGRRLVETWHEYIEQENERDLPNAVATQELIVVRPDFAVRLPTIYRRLLGKKPLRMIPNASSIPPQALTDAERAALRARYGGGADRRLIAFFG